MDAWVRPRVCFSEAETVAAPTLSGGALVIELAGPAHQPDCLIDQLGGKSGIALPYRDGQAIAGFGAEADGTGSG